MILKKCDMKTFSQRCQNKKIACYGIGQEFEKIIKSYEGYEWKKHISYLIDINEYKQGKDVILNDKQYKIIGLQEFLKENLQEVILFITCTAYYEVVRFLNKIEKLDKVECYIFHFMYGLSENKEIQIRQTQKIMIPSTIHYCWFGRKELPDLYKRCIESWHKYCPEYEIKEWNESNCNIEETIFTKQAYECGKYGFVPDYFRLKIIYEHGGIYLDTDVEVLRNLDDLRYNQAFCGVEYIGTSALGLGFGAVKGNKIIEYLAKRYKTERFLLEDGSINEIASPVLQSQDLIKIGLSYSPDVQKVEGLTIYPVEVLSPKSLRTGEVCITDYTYALHHYDGSWLSGERLNQKVEKEKRVKYIQDLFV